jgi:hypothetical protein
MQSLSLIPYFLISAVSEFKDQLVEAAEKEKVSKLQVVTELRELAAFKGQSGDASISAESVLMPSGKRLPRPKLHPLASSKR